MAGDGLLMFSHWAVGVAEFEHGKKRMVSFETTFVQGAESHVFLEPPDARDMADQLESFQLTQLVEVAEALRSAAINAEIHVFAVPARVQ